MKVACQGKWAPNMELVGSWLTPWLLEMGCLLPWPIFRVYAAILGFPISSCLSPGSADLQDGRKPMTLSYLNELVKVSFVALSNFCVYLLYWTFVCQY